MQEPKRRKHNSDFKEGDEIAHMCLLPETTEGRVAFQLLDRQIEKETKRLRKNPKRSDDLKEDIAYRIGYIEGLEYLKMLHEDAKEYVKSL